MTTTTEPTTQEAANRSYQSFIERVGQQLRVIKGADERNWDEVSESVRNSILEDPLSLTLWEVSPDFDDAKWNLLLGTGGPATRVLVSTDLGGDVDDAEYQYQDWFTPWTPAENQDRETVMEYARLFYYGVVGVTVDGGQYPY